jgi:hypothetical protein
VEQALSMRMLQGAKVGFHSKSSVNFVGLSTV